MDGHYVFENVGLNRNFRSCSKIKKGVIGKLRNAKRLLFRPPSPTLSQIFHGTIPLVESKRRFSK